MPLLPDLFGTETPAPAHPTMLFSTGVERHCLFRRPDARRHDGTHVHHLFASLGVPVDDRAAAPSRGVRRRLTTRRR